MGWKDSACSEKFGWIFAKSSPLTIRYLRISRLRQIFEPIEMHCTFDLKSVDCREIFHLIFIYRKRPPLVPLDWSINFLNEKLKVGLLLLLTNQNPETKVVVHYQIELHCSKLDIYAFVCSRKYKVKQLSSKPHHKVIEFLWKTQNPNRNSKQDFEFCIWYP